MHFAISSVSQRNRQKQLIEIIAARIVVWQRVAIARAQNLLQVTESEAEYSFILVRVSFSVSR